MLESIFISFKDIESHGQFPCASHSYSSNSMLGKNDTEVAAIVPVYYTFYLISIDYIICIIYISIYYLIYIYSWILTLTPPLNLM